MKDKAIKSVQRTSAGFAIENVRLELSDFWLGLLLLAVGAIGFYILYRRKLVWLAIPMAVAVGYFWTPLAGWLLAAAAEFVLIRLAARAKRGRL